MLGISQKPFGRESKLALRSSPRLPRSGETGRPERVLVSGYSGIGDRWTGARSALRQRAIPALSAVPAFVLTAAADIQERTAGMAPNLVIRKPFDIELLNGAIAAVANQQLIGSGRA